MNKCNHQFLFYRGKELATTRTGVESISLLSGRYLPLAEVLLKDVGASASLYAVDSLRTIQVARSGSAKKYTVFGFAGQSAIPDTLLGFTGQYCQPTGVYLLGNGYRAYSPVLMRFCSPDRLSPFGRGGINTYSYCGNDPVNYTDPSGGMRLWRSFKKGLTRLTGLSRKVKTHEKGRRTGYQEGHVAGVDKGYIGGKAVGTSEGYADGHRVGHADGHREGFDGGYSIGHSEGVKAVSNGTIPWKEWMMDPAYAEQTPRQALDNAKGGVEPYLMAGYYNGYTSSGINGNLHNIYLQSKGIRLPNRENRDYYINTFKETFPELQFSQ